jgi:uncharacterized protein
MGRLVALVLLVVAVVWLIRRALRRFDQASGGQKKDSVQGDLVSCAHCGMHLPRPEARESAGALYCSDEHARLGPGAR